MRLYTSLQAIQPDTYTGVLNYFFNHCDKVNIYFPTEASEELVQYKKTFLSATHIVEVEDEFSHLEPKEGFTMLIVSLSKEVQELLLKLKASYHLSFGLIEGTNVLFYISEEGECVIEVEDGDAILANPLFASFKSI